MNCIYCFKQIVSDLSWENIITGMKTSNLCFECTHSFIPLNGLLCKKCSAETKSEICDDCLKWSKLYNNEDVLTKNYAAFKYNEFTQNFVARWKYQGDFILIKGIKELITPYIKENLKHFDESFTILPIPLSKERLEERAFNQAFLLAELIGKSETAILIRKDNEKQSKKTKQERINTINPFKINKKITGKVLLVDDIYTTGTTLRHAASLLKQSGASEVNSFTFIRG